MTVSGCIADFDVSPNECAVREGLEFGRDGTTMRGSIMQTRIKR